MASNEAFVPLQYIRTLVWTCLSQTPAHIKNPVYDLVVPDAATLSKHFKDNNMSVAPGLHDVLKATAPPTLSFFKSLPTDGRGLLGVYAIVLEKFGRRPIVYVGSATDLIQGVSGRWNCYNSRNSISHQVQQALHKGFIISHKGLLCWTPIPAAVKSFRLRVVMVAIEATLATALWAMQSRTKDYGMPHLCPGHSTLSNTTAAPRTVL